MSEVRKIALFGGTFDPVHLGHVYMAQQAQTALALDEVRFLPCWISPHKVGLEPASPVDDRVEMLRRATAELPWAAVDDFELRRGGVSYSYETAEAMRERFPGARLFWIMGGDQWAALLRWHQPQRLSACVEFVVFARGNELVPRAGSLMQALAGSHPASATAIRQAFALGHTSHPWLHPAVADWIVRRRLYQSLRPSASDT
jgi:nicotinate-nucleotide adenylyltransferase